MKVKVGFVAVALALALLGLALAGAVAHGASSHQSGCHSQHTCPSDHHTYVWTDTSTGLLWDCVEPGASEYDSSRDTTTIVSSLAVLVSSPIRRRCLPMLEANALALLGAVERRSTDGPHWGVMTVRAIARRTAGHRSEAAAPRDPARLRCATSLVGRKDIPLQGVAPTFTVPNAMRAGRPDTARQSPRGVRPAVLSAHQRDSRRGVNLRSLPRPSDYRSATCATVSVRSRGQGLSASRENEPSRGDPLSHPDASPQSRPAWVPSGGVVPRLEDSLLLGIPAIPAGCFSPSFGCLRTRRASAGPIASRCPG